MFNPWVIQQGLPCTYVSILGKQDIEERKWERKLVKFGFQVLKHQDACNLLGCVENPASSGLYHLPEWSKEFGEPAFPAAGWQYVRLDGCQAHVVWPGIDKLNAPMQKGQYWIGNFDLSLMGQVCRHPVAVEPCDHQHMICRGTAPTMNRGWVGVGKASGTYTPQQADMLARCIRKALRGRKREEPRQETELQGLAALMGTDKEDEDSDPDEG